MGCEPTLIAVADFEPDEHIGEETVCEIDAAVLEQLVELGPGGHKTVARHPIAVRYAGLAALCVASHAVDVVP